MLTFGTILREDYVLTAAISLLVLGAVFWVVRRYAIRTRSRSRQRTRRSQMLNQIPGEMRWRVFERDNYTCQRCGTHSDLLVDFVDEPSGEMPPRLQSLTTRCVRCAVLVRESGIME